MEPSLIVIPLPLFYSSQGGYRNGLLQSCGGRRFNSSIGELVGSDARPARSHRHELGDIVIGVMLPTLQSPEHVMTPIFEADRIQGRPGDNRPSRTAK